MKQITFLPEPDEPPKKKPDPEGSAAGRALRARRRDALAAGHERAKKAGNRAEREDPGWTAAACELTIEFGRKKAAGFLIEDAAVYAYAHGLPQPKEKRSWGSVVLRLKKGDPGRRIVAIGFSTDNFGSPKTLWRAD